MPATVPQPLVCVRSTLLTIPRLLGRSLEPSNGSLCDRSAFASRSRIVHQTIEPAEPFHGKIHQRFGLGRTCSVRQVKRHIWTKFFFESFPFFMRATTENHFGTFFNETSDDAFSDSSSTACHHGDLIF